MAVSSGLPELSHQQKLQRTAEHMASIQTSVQGEGIRAALRLRRSASQQLLHHGGSRLRQCSRNSCRPGESRQPGGGLLDRFFSLITGS